MSNKIKLEQHFYASTTVGVTLAGRGFQTVAHSNGVGNPKLLEGHCAYSRVDRNAEPVNWGWFYLDDRRVCIHRIGYSGNDEIGRPGNLMAHNLITTVDELDAIDYDVTSLIRWVQRHSTKRYAYRRRPDGVITGVDLSEAAGADCTVDGFVRRHEQVFESFGKERSHLTSVPALEVSIDEVRTERGQAGECFKDATLSPLLAVLGADSLARLVATAVVAADSEETIEITGLSNGAGESAIELILADFLFAALPAHVRRSLTFSTYWQGGLTRAGRSSPHERRLLRMSLAGERRSTAAAQPRRATFLIDVPGQCVELPIASGMGKWMGDELVRGRRQWVWRVRDCACYFRFTSAEGGLADAYRLEFFQDPQAADYERLSRWSACLRRPYPKLLEVANRLVDERQSVVEMTVDQHRALILNYAQLLRRLSELGGFSSPEAMADAVRRLLKLIGSGVRFDFDGVVQLWRSLKELCSGSTAADDEFRRALGRALWAEMVRLAGEATQWRDRYDLELMTILRDIPISDVTHLEQLLDDVQKMEATRRPQQLLRRYLDGELANGHFNSRLLPELFDKRPDHLLRYFAAWEGAAARFPALRAEVADRLIDPQLIAIYWRTAPERHDVLFETSTCYVVEKFCRRPEGGEPLFSGPAAERVAQEYFDRIKQREGGLQSCLVACPGDSFADAVPAHLALLGMMANLVSSWEDAERRHGTKGLRAHLAMTIVETCIRAAARKELYTKVRLAELLSSLLRERQKPEQRIDEFRRLATQIRARCQQPRPALNVLCRAAKDLYPREEGTLYEECVLAPCTDDSATEEAWVLARLLVKHPKLMTEAASTSELHAHVKARVTQNVWRMISKIFAAEPPDSNQIYRWLAREGPCRVFIDALTGGWPPASPAPLLIDVAPPSGLSAQVQEAVAKLVCSFVQGEAASSPGWVSAEVAERNAAIAGCIAQVTHDLDPADLAAYWQLLGRCLPELSAERLRRYFPGIFRLGLWLQHWTKKDSMTCWEELFQHLAKHTQRLCEMYVAAGDGLFVEPLDDVHFAHVLNFSRFRWHATNWFCRQISHEDKWWYWVPVLGRWGEGGSEHVDWLAEAISRPPEAASRADQFSRQVMHEDLWWSWIPIVGRWGKGGREQVDGLAEAPHRSTEAANRADPINDGIRSLLARSRFAAAVYFDVCQDRMTGDKASLASIYAAMGNGCEENTAVAVVGFLIQNGTHSEGIQERARRLSRLFWEELCKEAKIKQRSLWDAILRQLQGLGIDPQVAKAVVGNFGRRIK